MRACILHSRRSGDGVAGAVDLVNDDAGADRRGARSRRATRVALSLDSEALQLDAIDAALADGGGVRGDARVALGGAQRSVRFALTCANVDLARVDTRSSSRRGCPGRIAADANAARQTLEGDVRDRDMALAFAAAIASGRIDVDAVSRKRRRRDARPARRAWRSTSATSSRVQATMQRLDPSRFAAVPAASLDGTVNASGALHPQWRAGRGRQHSRQRAGSPALPCRAMPGERLRRAAFRNLAVDVALGTARLHGNGSAGVARRSPRRHLDAPRLADIAPLLPSGVPQPLTGALHASGHVAIGKRRHRRRHRVAWHIAARRFLCRRDACRDAHRSPPPAPSRATLDSRALAFDIEATQLTLGARALDARARHGKRQRRQAPCNACAARRRDVDATLALDGSLRNIGDPAQASWSGTLTALDNRGSVPRAPSRPRVARACAAITCAWPMRASRSADGRADIGEFTWNDGRITTRGSFTSIALTTAARLAGRTLPVESTLVLGGDWSIAATPRLTGRFSVQRERGDIIADVPSGTTTRREGVGITTLTLAGTFHDDALDARANVRLGARRHAERHASRSALRAVRHRERSIRQRRCASPCAPRCRRLPFSSRGSAPRPRSTAAPNSTSRARGTLGNPLWSGTLAGEMLQVDAPQYGVHIGDGQLRAHLVPAGLALDSCGSAGGDGTFDANGLIAIPGERNGDATHVAWKARALSHRQPARPSLCRRRQRQRRAREQALRVARQPDRRRRPRRIRAVAHRQARVRHRHQGRAGAARRHHGAATFRWRSTSRSTSGAISRLPARDSTHGSPAASM